MNDVIDSEIVDQRPVATAGPRQQLVPMASLQCAAVWGALAEAQGKFEIPRRTKEATISGTTRAGASYNYKYKYAPLEEMIRAVTAALAENKLFRQQYLVTRGNDYFIRTIIAHASGEWIACDYPVMADKPGAQGFASGVSYARRYGLALALGLAPEDDDDAQIADNHDNAHTIYEKDRRRTAAPPAPPHPVDPPHDPETGEVLPPHRIPIPEDGRGRSFIKWGSTLIAAFKAARSQDELDEWAAKCQGEIDEAAEHAPKAHAAVMGSLAAARAKIGPEDGPEFVGVEEAESVLQRARTGA